MENIQSESHTKSVFERLGLDRGIEYAYARLLVGYVISDKRRGKDERLRHKKVNSPLNVDRKFNIRHLPLKVIAAVYLCALYIEQKFGLE